MLRLIFLGGTLAIFLHCLVIVMNISWRNIVLNVPIKFIVDKLYIVNEENL